MSETVLRKEAYRYIQAILSKLPIDPSDIDRSPVISLEELAKLKEGLADPSVSLIASLKKLLSGIVTEDEIEIHLVLPFVEYSQKHSQETEGGTPIA